MDDDTFWTEPCGARSYGLTHTRDSGGWNKCQDCGLVPSPVAAPAGVLAVIPTSIARLDEPNPMTGCVLDHSTIEAKLLIGDSGLRWAHCPFCNVMVEAKLAAGIDAPTGAIGPAWGPGRGEWFNPRLLKRLTAWVGWLDFRGDGR
jgi:hypothetical protein